MSTEPAPNPNSQPRDPLEGVMLPVTDLVPQPPSEAEVRVIDGMYGIPLAYGQLMPEEAAHGAAESVEIAAMLDDEALLEAYENVSGIQETMKRWDEHLGVDPEAVGENFDTLVQAYATQNGDLAEEVLARMGVTDQDLQQRAITNLGRNFRLNKSGHASKDTHTLTRNLLTPMNDEGFLKRFREAGEAYNVVDRAIESLPFIDPERAEHVYEMALASPNATVHSMMGVTSGTIRLTLLKGEEVLPLWRQAAELATQNDDFLEVVGRAIESTAAELDERVAMTEGDLEGDPKQMAADQALSIKLNGLLYSLLPSSEQVMEQMKRRIDETDIPGDPRHN